jgi:predicted phosphodiesterase
MRIFAVSDIHIDYDVNARWLSGISNADHQDDLLILAGDVTDNRALLEWALVTLARRFRKVLFVPGNHDLWVIREDRKKHSLQKFEEIRDIVEASGASMQPYRDRGVSLIPLLAWYDYSFGQPTHELRTMWMDYVACRWPAGYGEDEVAAHFASLNDGQRFSDAGKVITYSHFLPRIDVMPGFMPPASQTLFPILGTTRLDRQLRALNASVHVYGHSHINRNVEIDGVTYINNAFGYPNETRIAAKQLMCIHED